MFFIGGFNTVLPYLLYISLLWAFMIIGLSGKLNFLKPGKAIHTEKNVTVGISGNSIHYLNQDPDSHNTEIEIVTVKTNLPDPVTLVCNIVAGVKPGLCRYLPFISFRGPPHLHSQY